MPDYNFMFDCQIDCPFPECLKDDCEYYIFHDCCICHWFWECPNADCDFKEKQHLINNPDELQQMTDFANWVIEKRKKEQQGS